MAIYLEPKCRNYAMKLINEKIINFFIKIISIYASIFWKLTKFRFQVDTTLLNNYYLIYKGDLLSTKVPKLRSKIFVYFRNITIFLFFYILYKNYPNNCHYKLIKSFSTRKITYIFAFKYEYFSIFQLESWKKCVF